MRGFLISTKQSQPTQTDPINGFSISKETGHEKVKTFIGKSFAIVPESLNDPSGKLDGHVYGGSRDELVQGYNNHSHGIIKGLFGPFYYNDGTDDYYYDFNIKLNDSQSAGAIIEYGERMWTPYSVSPHVVWLAEGNTDWEGVGVALVRRGSYGDQAIITKLCEGTEKQCDRSNSAGACTCCAKSDEYIAKSITSLVQSAASQTQMSNNLSTTTASGTTPFYTTATTVPEVKTEVPPVEEKKEEPKQITMSPQEYEALMEKVTKADNLQKTVQDLENEFKTNVLNQIFTTETVEDDNIRKDLFDKYFAVKDVKLIKQLWTDFNAHIVPTIVKKVKAETEKPVEEKEEPETEEKSAKRKSSAGSLKPEPKVEKESAGAVIKKVNEAQLIHDAIFGEFR